MLRTIAGAVAGVIVWAAVVTLLDFCLRHGWADYAAVEKAMTFTIPMMAARLTESGVSSIVSGWAAAAIGKRRLSALIAGVVLLAVFIPIHYALLSKFPLWYHLTFLISLPVLSMLGGRLAKVSP